jgi:hypothetical protein
MNRERSENSPVPHPQLRSASGKLPRFDKLGAIATVNQRAREKFAAKTETG